MGEVLQTASILKVLGEILLCIVPRNVALAGQVGECEASEFGQFGGLAERKNALRIERQGKLHAKPGLDFGHREANAICNGVRYVEVVSHSSTFSLAPLMRLLDVVAEFRFDPSWVGWLGDWTDAMLG
jgi:hypothetical protein